MTRRPIFAVLVVLLIGAGFYLGVAVRGRGQAAPPGPPGSALVDGDVFPDVVLTGEDGVPRSTDEILGTDGGILLFLDLECAPCNDVSVRWERLLADGRLDDTQVIGVSSGSSAEEILKYKQRLGLSFPIYDDPEWVFFSTYGVNEFPLRVVVDRSGRIRGQAYGRDDALAPDEVAHLLR